MKSTRAPCLAALLAGTLTCGSAVAVDFGVMETATTVTPGFFKFASHPVFAKRAARREQGMGVGMIFGYGLTQWLDVEALMASYDDATFFGTDLELWFLDGLHIDASTGVGVHYGDTDFGDQIGFDMTQILTYTPQGQSAFNLTAALDLAFDGLDRSRGAVNAGMDDNLNFVHVVPGLQYRLGWNLDLIGEFGIGLTDDSRDFASVGLAYYFAR